MFLRFFIDSVLRFSVLDSSYWDVWDSNHSAMIHYFPREENYSHRLASSR